MFKAYFGNQFFVDRSKMRDYMRRGEVEEGGERSGESQLLSWIPAPGQGGSENIV